MKKPTKPTENTSKDAETRKGSWTFRPEEDVYEAVLAEERDFPDKWKSRSQLINQALRECLAENTADAIEHIVIARRVTELQEQIEALRTLQAAKAAKNPDQLRDAKAALRSIYRRRGSDNPV